MKSSAARNPSDTTTVVGRPPVRQSTIVRSDVDQTLRGVRPDDRDLVAGRAAVHRVGPSTDSSHPGPRLSPT